MSQQNGARWSMLFISTVSGFNALSDQCICCEFMLSDFQTEADTEGGTKVYQELIGQLDFALTD